MESAPLQPRSLPSNETFVKGILNGNRTLLSRAITLIESTRVDHTEKAQAIVEACLPHSGNSFRVGITGVPGVGKSTFIEALGMELIGRGKKLAVLAVDPSSSRSGGAILGDKTRMDRLSREENAFIRPSAAGASLGGVARKTRESIVLCEAAGFDTLFIETVGVGQSETAVHSMVDFFLLLMLAGAGDELQGIKRGIMEMAEGMVINKADGDNLSAARRARSDYQRALHLFPAHPGNWTPQVRHCSALHNEGIAEFWDTVILDYLNTTQDNGYFQLRREQQAKYWFREHLEERLYRNFYSDRAVRTQMNELEQRVLKQEMTPFKAAEYLFALWKKEV